MTQHPNHPARPWWRYAEATAPQATRWTSTVTVAGVTALLMVGCAGCTASDDASGGADSGVTVTIPEGQAVDQAAGVGENFSYTGQDGHTALDLLLKADPTAEVRGSGDQAFVVGIHGRRAKEAKHEFWALYVNGVQATVGAGSLDTKTGDIIEWTIDTY